MTHYVVFSPEIQMYDGDELDPPEYGCCVVSVDAKNKREAKSLAIKQDRFEKWMRFSSDNRSNPFTGLKAEIHICPHGICHCELCNKECEDCTAELNT